MLEDGTIRSRPGAVARCPPRARRTGRPLTIRRPAGTTALRERFATALGAAITRPPPATRKATAVTLERCAPVQRISEPPVAVRGPAQARSQRIRVGCGPGGRAEAATARTAEAVATVTVTANRSGPDLTASLSSTYPSS